MIVHGRRWVVPGQGQSVVEEYELPTLGEREILVATTCSAVSSGTEAAIHTGADEAVWEPDGWCRYPCAMGYSGVGTVVRVGSAVREFTVGQRVVGQLGHASHWVLDVDGMVGQEWSNRPVCAIGAEIDDHSAALIRIAGIAMTPVQLVRRWETVGVGVVGVWGLGIIGNIAAQLLRCAGAVVVGVDPDPTRRAIAEAVGLDAVSAPDDDVADRIRELAPRGLAAAVDTVGDSRLTVSLPDHLAMAGELVLMTHWRHQPTIDANRFIRQIFGKGISVHGGLEYGPGSRDWDSWARLQFAKWRRIEALVRSHTLHLAELVTLIVGPTEHDHVYRLLAAGSPEHLGIVVRWNEAA